MTQSFLGRTACFVEKSGLNFLNYSTLPPTYFYIFFKLKK
jgi:hypothetical protein